ncbi:MAG: hypothetical protein BYD32DRAFT_492192 [Podila humilis]|nr:MAG: hypothetical protein BYD32DRAFT_492192 [Podila humilis]
MKFTAFTAIVLATIALAASSAEALTCYQRCLKEGESAAVCGDSCYDRDCYRRCVREGESASYCKKSCRN